MAAGILNLEVEQGVTFEKRIYFLNKRIITAILDPAMTVLVGSTNLTVLAGGVGVINANDFIIVHYENEERAYKVLTGIADLSLGGTITLAQPIEQVIQGNLITVAYPIDLTGSTFESQIRTAADSPDIIASITATIATTPTDGYYDLLMTDATTSAIPTIGKTDYTKKAKYTSDGELKLGGKVIRVYNGTVYVSPETTRIV